MKRLFPLILILLVVTSIGNAQVLAAASISAISIPSGQSVNFTRNGSTPNGFAWSEATLWQPGGSYTILGTVYSNPYTQMVTPSAGPGTYWIQFRLVDSSYNFQDQWLSFQVLPQAPTPQASISPSEIIDGESILLNRSGQTPGGFGWTENVIWQPNGQAAVVADRSLGAISYTPVAGPGAYWYQYRLVDTFQQYTDQWIPFYVGMKFQILIDLNQLRDTDLPQIGALSSDGVWSLPFNSPSIATTANFNQTAVSLWNNAFKSLNADKWLVSENLYGDDTIDYWTRRIMAGPNWVPGSYLAPTNAQQVYIETPTDNFLSISQLADASANYGYNNVVVHTRTYTGIRFDEANILLADPRVSGLTIETNPEPEGSSMWNQNFNAAIDHCLSLGKKCYLLLPPKANCQNYTDDIKAAMRYFSQSHGMNNPNLYIVLAVYDRDNNNVGFLGGQNGTASSNSILSALTWLKAYRASKAPLQ